MNANNLTITTSGISSASIRSDSYIKSINDYSNVDFNGYKLYINGIEIKK